MDILIDFDGTCVTHEFPKVGKDIGAAPILKELVANGHNLILFTMRSDVINQKSNDPTIIPISGNYLTDAIEWFKKNDIPLYGIQTNPTQHTWTSSPKAYGQIMIDDSAIGCPLHYGLFDNDLNYVEYSRPYVNWKKVRKILVSDGIFVLS